MSAEDLSFRAFSGLTLVCRRREFERYDDNKDNIIDKFEFQKFVAADKIPFEQVAESSGTLTYSDFIEYKITGKLRNEKVCVCPRRHRSLFFIFPNLQSRFVGLGWIKAEIRRNGSLQQRSWSEILRFQQNAAELGSPSEADGRLRCNCCRLEGTCRRPAP